MKLYDKIIRSVLELTENCSIRALSATEKSWKTVSDRSMILRSEMAFELGSERLPGLGATLVSGDPALVPGDEVLLIGRDIPELSADSPYARLAIVLVDENTLGEGQALYSAVRKLEYTKYHFYPEGFMMRVSSSKQKESVRIGKAARDNGLDFSTVGSMLIQKFREDPHVRAVRLIYITDPAFDFRALEKLVYDSEDITKTIDHIGQNITMDCKACSLQPICDEVEGLKELHFGTGTDK